MKNIPHLLDVVDSVRDHVALGLMSDPGLSKTSQVKQWADENRREYCELIISQRMPSEISGMPMPIPDERKMEVFDFQTLLNLKDGDVLAFDEFTNGNIMTLNACLTLIQERTMLSGHRLPSLVVVAMGNPQGKCDLLPQTKQRFWWVDVQWDAPTWSDYMTRTWGCTPSSRLVDMISEQYRQGFGDTAKFNYITPRTVENLLRIAMKIEQNDPFWCACDMTHDLIEALYQTIANVDSFRKLRDELLDWVDEVAFADGAQWITYVRKGLSECTTMGELRRFIDDTERNEYAPEFIQHLKATDPAGAE